MRSRDRNFPGDSECYAGLVKEDDLTSHVCLNCHGEGCKPKRQVRRAATTERLRSLSGSTVLSDQKGRAVFVDLEKGTAYVVDA
jgi:hypothetical protein